MTTTDLRARAYAIGFSDRPHVPELSDRPIGGLIYMARVHAGQHQYLSLVYTPNHLPHRFLEAIVEVYHTARNPKAKRNGSLADQQKRGAANLHTNIARSWEEIEALVGRTYELAKG